VLVAGASGGIGSACARALAGEGARVVVHYHLGEERAQALAEEIGAAAVARADLTSEDDVERLIGEVLPLVDKAVGGLKQFGPGSAIAAAR